MNTCLPRPHAQLFQGCQRHLVHLDRFLAHVGHRPDAGRSMRSHTAGFAETLSTLTTFIMARITPEVPDRVVGGATYAFAYAGPGRITITNNEPRMSSPAEHCDRSRRAQQSQQSRPVTQCFPSRRPVATWDALWRARTALQSRESKEDWRPCGRPRSS